jgi:hypothetical protein
VLREEGLWDATWQRRIEHKQRRCEPRVACRIYRGAEASGSASRRVHDRTVREEGSC